jgi:hypothetical protein
MMWSTLNISSDYQFGNEISKLNEMRVIDWSQSTETMLVVKMDHQTLILFLRSFHAGLSEDSFDFSAAVSEYILTELSPCFS